MARLSLQIEKWFGGQEYNFNVREDFRGEGPKSQKGNEEAEKEEVAFNNQRSAESDQLSAISNQNEPALDAGS
jgi:hypothetical protein